MKGYYEVVIHLESANIDIEQHNLRVQVIWFGIVIAIALVAGVSVGIPYPPWFGEDIWTGLCVFLLATMFGAAYTHRWYHIWQFGIEADAVTLAHGVITRVNPVVPFVRIQHIDTQRDPVEFLAGLSRVIVYTAGSRGSDITSSGLILERARSVQTQLRQLTIKSESRAFEDAV